jgi:hypothetical protein
MQAIYKEGFDFIDTSESYYENYVLRNGNILLPYINLCLMKGHPLNELKHFVNLDYGYLILTDVVLIKKNDIWIYDDTSFKYDKYEFLTVGGTNIKIGHDEELKILYNKGYLEVSPKARLSEHPWIPIGSPNSDVNLNEQEVGDFFSLKNLSADLKSLFL